MKSFFSGSGWMVMSMVLVAGVASAQMNRIGGARPVSGGARTISGGATVGVGAGAGGVLGGEKAEKVAIKRFPAPNKASMVRSPEFTVNVSNMQPKTTKKPREWALFEIKYETAAKWTDELSFTYHVMTKGRDSEGKDGYSYYTLALRYVNIPKGEHMSCVAIPPSLVERYGEPVSLALEIVGKDGAVLDAQSESLIPYPSKEWWKDSKVLDMSQVTRRTGLVDRSKTPFALINMDDYEVVQ